MSGISEERLQDVERALMGRSMEAVGIVLKNAPDMLAEICRLRAENEELRESYERVDRALRERQAMPRW